MNRVKRWLVERAIRKFLEGQQMKELKEWLSGKKTYIAALGTILAGLSSLLGIPIPGLPVISPAEAVQMIVTAIMVAFLRQGVTKSGPTA